MTVGNLAVCFGPTLLRPEEETVASIMDIKFHNIVVEILIENCERIAAGPPQEFSRPIAVPQNPNPTKPRNLETEESQSTTGNGNASLTRYSLHPAVASPQTHVSPAPDPPDSRLSTCVQSISSIDLYQQCVQLIDTICKIRLYDSFVQFTCVIYMCN